MLLTADHLAALEDLGGDTFDPTPLSAPSERANAVYRALARDGLACRMRGQSYSLTAEGRDARGLVVGMLAGGYLGPREVMAPDWHFIDDEVLAAMEAAVRDADRVALADAPLLLVRGLAALREVPDELHVYVALTPYGRAWLGLTRRLRKHAESTYGPALLVGAAAGNLEREAQPNFAPA
jgi:hypothetical protein